MLHVMRRHSQSFLIYLIFGAIIVVFAVNFGPGSSGCSGGMASEYAAKVNDDVIPRQEFSQLYSRQLDSMRRSARASGSEFTEDMARRLGLRTQIIDGLIEQRLLAQEAKKRGLTVSDDDLLEYLEETFRIGDVNFADYQGWVNRQFQTTVVKFEQEVRDEIVSERMRRIVREGVSISDGELRETFARDNDRAMVTFIRFDTQEIDVEAPSAEAIAELLEEETEAVEKKYDTEKFKYRTPKRVKARQILKALASDASDADVAKARGELLELKSQIDGGADFGSLAKSQTADEAGKESGGEMGWLERGKVAKSIIDAVFELNTDDILGDPVRSPQGLHLIQVTEIEAAAVKELDEVKEEVATTLLEERSADVIAEEQAKGFMAKLVAGESFDELTLTVEEKRELEEAASDAEGVADFKPVRKDTPWMLKGFEVLPLIGSSQELHDEIFTQLSTDNPVASRPYKVGRAWVVVNLKEREMPDFSKFEESKDTLRTQAVSLKSSKVYRAWIDYLRKESVIQLSTELFGSDENA